MTSTVPCVVCSSPTTRDPFYYVWLEQHWRIRRCSSCTHQFVHPPVGPEEQAMIYGDNYFSQGGDWAAGYFGGKGYTDAEESLRREAKQILAMIPFSHGRLLDIGCAGGVFLDEARKAGFVVSGVEYSRSMVRHCHERFGLQVVQGTIESILETTWHHEFDVVTMLDVLEHVPGPREAMARIGRWAKPSAHLVIRGPLSNSPVARVKETARRLLNIDKQLPGYPLDANMWNKRSLCELIRPYGFKPIAWPGEGSGSANLIARRG